MSLLIDGRIMQDSLVRDAVIFGLDMPVPGLLLFRANTEEAGSLSNTGYLGSCLAKF